MGHPHRRRVEHPDAPASEALDHCVLRTATRLFVNRGDAETPDGAGGPCRRAFFDAAWRLFTEGAVARRLLSARMS